MNAKLQALKGFALRHSKTLAGLVLPVVAMSANSAMAVEAADVAPVVTAIGAIAAIVALIGAPKLIMKVGVKVWTWISSAI